MHCGYLEYYKNLKISSSQTCSNFSLARSKNLIYWATLKFDKTSNFSKGGTPRYCLMAIYTSETVLDNGTCP